MQKRNKKNSFIILHLILSVTSSISLVAGLGISNQNYEKVAFAYADIYAANNFSTNSTLIFEYTPKKEIINKKTINDYNNFLNDFSGTRKYFPLACGWTQSEETKITFDDFTINTTFSDISYLENNNIEYASNLLQLSYPETYAEAFDESSDKIYLAGDELKMKPKSTYILSARKGIDNLSNNAVNWSSSNTSVAEIENGQITAKSEGETIITAKLDGLSDEIKIIVSSEFTKTEITSFTPCIVPLHIANFFANESANDAIGKIFNAVFNNELVTFKIGGYYEDVATTNPYRNELYSNNIGQQIYILRSSKYYHYPVEKIYFTLTSQYKINMNMYNDIHYLKTISNLNFSIPENMPINNVNFSSENNTKIYNYISYTKSTENKVVGWCLTVLFAVLLFFDFFFLRKKINIKIFYTISYIFELLLIPSILYLIQPITISNKIYFIMNSVTGGIIISIGIIYASILTYLLISGKPKQLDFINRNEINI